jgi:hypothetical protein
LQPGKEEIEVKPKAPCLKCEDRNPGCHSRCEKYIDYKKKQFEYNQLKAKERMIDNIAKDRLYY